METITRLIISQHGDEFEVMITMEKNGERLAALIIARENNENDAAIKAHKIQCELSCCWYE